MRALKFSFVLLITIALAYRLALSLSPSRSVAIEKRTENGIRVIHGVKYKVSYSSDKAVISVKAKSIVEYLFLDEVCFMSLVIVLVMFVLISLRIGERLFLKTRQHRLPGEFAANALLLALAFSEFLKYGITKAWVQTKFGIFGYSYASYLPGEWLFLLLVVAAYVIARRPSVSAN